MAIEAVSQITNQVAKVGTSQLNEKGVMLDESTVPAFKEGEMFKNLINGSVEFSDPSRITAAHGPRQPLSPSSSVLNSIQEVRHWIDKIQDKIVLLTNKGSDLSSVDLFQLQYYVMQMSYINELSSKTADKVSQAAQTLFRNQG